MSLLGLLGGHRVGKTTLAKTYAEKHGAPFVETSVSAIFKELGHSPSERFDFKTRLDIQEVILDRLETLYASQNAGVIGITDRTPIDLLGYTMSEAIGSAVSEADQLRFALYTQRCFDMTTKWFAMIMLVQPGIVLIDAPGKAVVNMAYIEHLNSLMFGLSCDPRVMIPSFYMRREYLTVEERMQALENSSSRAMMIVLQQEKNYLAEGLRLQ